MSREDEVKGSIAPGQYADFAALSADYFQVPDEEIRSIVSVLTVVDGKVVHGAEEFSHLSAAAPAGVSRLGAGPAAPVVSPAPSERSALPRSAATVCRSCGDLSGVAAGRTDAVWPGPTARAWAVLLMWSLCAGVAAAQSSTQSEPPDAPARPDYELLRDEEDWSFLVDRSRANDLWDPVKFMPFGSPRGSYLSLGGEVRQQYERFTNEEWGAEPRDDSGYWLQRLMVHADLRLGRQVRLFGQLKSGIEAGRVGGPRRPDEDRLDLHQGYAELHAPLGVGESTSANPRRSTGAELRLEPSRVGSRGSECEAEL